MILKKWTSGAHLLLKWYWYMKQILGERLQDHWSSCFLLFKCNFKLDVFISFQVVSIFCLRLNFVQLSF